MEGDGRSHGCGTRWGDSPASRNHAKWLEGDAAGSMTRGLTELLPFKTILHPTDLSEHADKAYQLAGLINRECGARLIVLHVVGIHVDLPQCILTEMSLASDCPGDYQRHDEALRDQLHERFESNPDVRVEARLIDGAAAAAILVSPKTSVAT
jgi:hypothetical protein